jgi:hypothetical protein
MLIDMSDENTYGNVWLNIYKMMVMVMVMMMAVDDNNNDDNDDVIIMVVMINDDDNNDDNGVRMIITLFKINGIERCFPSLYEKSIKETVECKHQILKSYLHYPHQHRR